MTIQDKIQPDQNAPFDGIKESGEKTPAYFNILYYGLIIWGVIFMGYYLFSGWSSQGEFQEKMQTHQAQTGQGKR